MAANTAFADFPRLSALLAGHGFYRASEQALRDYAVGQGMRTLRDDGLRWAAQGVISLEEVVRVTRE